MHKALTISGRFNFKGGKMNHYMVKSELVRLGAECKNARKASGVTQEEIAKALGVTKQNISAFELGKINNLKIYMYYVERFKNGTKEH